MATGTQHKWQTAGGAALPARLSWPSPQASMIDPVVHMWQSATAASDHSHTGPPAFVCILAVFAASEALLVDWCSKKSCAASSPSTVSRNPVRV